VTVLVSSGLNSTLRTVDNGHLSITLGLDCVCAFIPSASFGTTVYHLMKDMLIRDLKGEIQLRYN
jgi:hypothetical protein